MSSNLLFSFPTIFSIFTFFIFSSAFSRSLFESNPPTAILDVSASLKQAHQVLSFKPIDSLHQTNPSNFSSLAFSSSVTPFSIDLHPREALQNSKHQDYQSLVLSRLNRDSARVNSLLTKLQLILDNKSDLEPMETKLRPEELSTPIISGSSQGSGEYFSRLGIGSPSKSFSMALDTGSDINWLQCQPCSESCYQQSDPIFDPKDSSTYKPLTCESQQCKYLQRSGCRIKSCQYQVNYGDGSFSVGDFATDTVSFGNTGSLNDVALGCGHNNQGLFVGAAGLLGLGGGPLSLVSQIKATSFSYCLVNRDSDSSSTLDFNSAAPADSVTASLLKNAKIDTFYYVELIGLSVGGQPLSISPDLFLIDESGNGGIIVDSGTTITRLQTKVYEPLRDSFKKLTTHLPPANSGIDLFDTCYDLSSQTSVRVPTVSFQFSGGKSLDIPANNYLIPIDTKGTFCFAFAPTRSSLSIIGNVQQQGIRVSFDLANSRVGFSPRKC